MKPSTADIGYASALRIVGHAFRSAFRAAAVAGESVGSAAVAPACTAIHMLPARSCCGAQPRFSTCLKPSMMAEAKGWRIVMAIKPSGYLAGRGMDSGRCNRRTLDLAEVVAGPGLLAGALSNSSLTPTTTLVEHASCADEYSSADTKGNPACLGRSIVLNEASASLVVAGSAKPPISGPLKSASVHLRASAPAFSTVCKVARLTAIAAADAAAVEAASSAEFSDPALGRMFCIASLDKCRGAGVPRFEGEMRGAPEGAASPG
eukprot:scaffold256668_cov35-Tisochrysis_lutea.AAC.3